MANPTVSAELLDQERERSLENFKREFLAEFTDNVVSWIEAEVLDACIVQGRKELPRVSDVTYAAAVDPAFKQSDFVLVIAHRTSGGHTPTERSSALCKPPRGQNGSTDQGGKKIATFKANPEYLWRRLFERAEPATVVSVPNDPFARFATLIGSSSRRNETRASASLFLAKQSLP